MDERKLIYADDAIEAIEEITWYHQNINNEMVRGANSSEDQAWYKAEDVYEALEQLSSVQPEHLVKESGNLVKGLVNDCISRQAAIDEIDEWIEAFKENGHKESASDAHFIKVGIGALPSAQPEIIRCKDCIKRDYCRTTNIWAVPPNDDWYCGDAERSVHPETEERTAESAQNVPNDELILKKAAIDMVRTYYADDYDITDSIEELIEKLPSVQQCDTCRYAGLEWDEEPCDSCTRGGETNHYKPSVQPEKMQLSKEDATKGTTFDCIDRQSAIDALNRHLETISVVNNNTMEMIRRSEAIDCREIINGLPSAEVETQMSLADCISRQAAIDALNEYFARIGKLKRRGLNKGEKAISLDTVETIKNLPSAQPYTEEEIQAMQDLEQAQLDKAYQIGVEEGLQSAQPEPPEDICGECDAWNKYKSEIKAFASAQPVVLRTEMSSANDTISRQAAIDSVCEVCENCEYFKNEKLIQTIKDLPPVQPRWIPVTEALPEDAYQCIVTAKVKHVDNYPDYEVDTADFADGIFTTDNSWWGVESIIAWMPLPEPYKEEQDD